MSALVTAAAEVGDPWCVDGDEVLLVVGACEQCAHVFFPPQEYGCERCGSDSLTRRAVSSRGTVVALVVAPRGDGDVHIAELRLDETGVLLQAPAVAGVRAGDVVMAHVTDERVELVHAEVV